MTYIIDTLKASQELRSAGFKKAEVEALIRTLSPTSRDVVSSDKLDSAVNRLKSELVVWMVGLHIASISLLVALLG